MPATPTSPLAPSRLLGASAAELKFRIQGGEHDGRILRITGAKCTIGSARGCTLRLRGYGIEPLHCLILAGRNGTVVRRNSPRTYLNGGIFEDIALKTGDMLRVGPVELAVVACPQAIGTSQSSSTAQQQPLQEPAELAELAELKREQQRLTTELAAMGEELRAAREQLKQARQDAGEPPAENTRLVNQLREQYAEALQRFLDQRAAALVREEELQDELNRAQQHAQDQETRFAERETAWQKQLATQRQDVSALQQAIAQERAAAGAARQQLQEKVAILEGLLQKARQRSPDPQPSVGGQQSGQQTVAFPVLLVERERELVQRDAELAELRQRVADLGAADEKVKQLEEVLNSNALARQAERQAWQQEKNQLEVANGDLVAQQEAADLQAAHNQDAASARCQSLEKQISELQSRLEQAQEYKQQLERWQSEAQTWQSRAEGIESQLGEMRQHCTRQEAEIAELQAALNSSRSLASESQTVDALRNQLEMQRQELVEARLQFQQEQAHLERLLAETSSREEVLGRVEAELRERDAAWNIARAEQSSALEKRSQLIASQIEQFEAEQAAFSRQQATIIQQMSALEDRVQELTAASESRTTNSPFVIPRLDDPSLQGGLERATLPYVRRGSAMRTEGGTCMTQLMDPQQSPLEPSAEAAQPVKPACTAGGAKQDDSMAQYMDRLLSRVHGDAAPSESVPLEREEDAHQEPSQEISPAEVEKLAEPKEYVPHAATKQPERLSLMRELASSASHTRAGQHQIRETKDKSLVARLSLIGALGLFAVAFATGSTIAMAGAMIFIAVSSVISLRALAKAIRRMRLTRPQEIGETPEVTPSTPHSDEKPGPV